MPVRNKAIAVLETFDGCRHEDAYVAMVESIDWNRVQIEAAGRCLARHSNLFKDDIDIPCGACLCDTMLETKTFPDYLVGRN